MKIFALYAVLLFVGVGLGLGAARLITYFFRPKIISQLISHEPDGQFGRRGTYLIGPKLKSGTIEENVILQGAWSDDQ